MHSRKADAPGGPDEAREGRADIRHVGDFDRCACTGPGNGEGHCDPVIALAEGRVVFQGTVAEAQADPLLLEAYLGTAA